MAPASVAVNVKIKKEKIRIVIKNWLGLGRRR